MSSSLRIFAVSIVSLLAACEHDSTVGSQVDAPGATGDGAIDGVTQPGTCILGNDRLLFGGPFVVDTMTVAYVTISDKVVGVAAQQSGKTLSFTVRNALTQNLDTIGDHDVATTNLKHLEIPSGADCDTDPPGTCNGFFALAGTFSVTQIQPRYRATFILTDLRERHDNTNVLGPAIAGTITGCLDVQAP